jgi:hypothetical protein
MGECYNFWCSCTNANAIPRRLHVLEPRPFWRRLFCSTKSLAWARPTLNVVGAVCNRLLALLRLVGMTGGSLSSRRNGLIWSGMDRMEGCGHNQDDIEVCPLLLLGVFGLSLYPVYRVRVPHLAQTSLKPLCLDAVDLAACCVQTSLSSYDTMI